MPNRYTSTNQGPNQQAHSQSSPPQQSPDRRQFPRPLGLHLSHAMFYSQNWPAVSNSCMNVWSGWKPNSSDLSAGFNIPSPDASAFLHAASGAGLDEFQTWLNGVAAYQNAPLLPATPPVPVVWEEGITRVFNYTTTDTRSADTVVVILPSLINRSTILDVLPDLSMARALAQHHAVWLVDWGAPGETEKTFTVDDYIMQRVLPVLALARAQHKKVVLLGYCMGGLLALGAAMHAPLDGLVLLATPWDFYAYPMPVRVGLAQMTAGFLPWLHSGQPLTVDMLQMLFTLLQPMAVFDKFKKVGRSQDQGGGYDDLFVAIEDWVNDGVPLAPRVAETCLIDWFQNNTTYAGGWMVGGRAVCPQAITAPTLLLVPDADRIVPAAAALPLADFIPNADIRRVAPGHVGMVAGRTAARTVWPQLASFVSSV
jgi:polyhydroxyalkanoate synthase